MGHHDKWKRWKTTWLNIFHIKKKHIKKFWVIDKLKCARNVVWRILCHFYRPRPLKRGKIWSHGASWQMKMLRNYLTRHISYKREHVKKLSHRQVERCKKCWVWVLFLHFYTTWPPEKLKMVHRLKRHMERLNYW